MNIAIFTHYFWPESFIINQLADSLTNKDNSIEVLTGKPNYPLGKIYGGYRCTGTQKEKLGLVNVNRIPIYPRGKGAIKLALNYASFVVSGIIFSPWLLRNKKLDVIFVFAPSPLLPVIPALFVGWIKNIPTVLWVQDLWPQSLSATGYIKNKTVLKIVELVVRLIYKNVDLILVQSKAFEKPVKKLVKKTPVQYLPNPVEDAFFEPALPSDNPLITSLKNKFTVTFAGNIGSAQAVFVIIEAAKLLEKNDKIHFLVIGTGSQYQWMLAQVKLYNLCNISLTGRLPSEQMPNILQHSSVLLVTLTNQEIFTYTVPSKIQAYMAAGRPILACLNGEGAKIITEAKAGLAVPAENSLLLSKAITKLYNIPEVELNDIGQRGRSYCLKHFKLTEISNDLIAHFERTINNKKGL